MATFTNQTKNSFTATNQTKNVGTFTNTGKGMSGAVLATSGLYYGFGAFTYAGGETLGVGSLPVFTNLTKN